MNKKKLLFSIIICIIIVITLGCFFKFFYQPEITKDQRKLYEQAISYLKAHNNSYDATKEDYQEFYSYDPLGIKKDNNKIYIYMAILEDDCYLKENQLEKSSSSALFYKFTIKDQKIIKYEMPKDGNEYKDSIKKIFPKKLQNKILNYDFTKLNQENKSKIEKYYAYLKEK